MTAVDWYLVGMGSLQLLLFVCHLHLDRLNADHARINRDFGAENERNARRLLAISVLDDEQRAVYLEAVARERSRWARWTRWSRGGDA